MVSESMGAKSDLFLIILSKHGVFYLHDPDLGEIAKQKLEMQRKDLFIISILGINTTRSTIRNAGGNSQDKIIWVMYLVWA